MREKSSCGFSMNKTNHPISSNSHPSAAANKAIHSFKIEGGGGVLQNQRKHHIILTKYEAVHPTAVSENNSSSGMLIILTINRTVCITNVIPNEYILEYSSAVAIMYITKY